MIVPGRMVVLGRVVLGLGDCGVAMLDLGGMVAGGVLDQASGRGQAAFQ